MNHKGCCGQACGVELHRGHRARASLVDVWNVPEQEVGGEVLGGRGADEGGEHARLRAAPETHAQAAVEGIPGILYAVLCATGDLSAAPNLFH